jgi:hypothetical protein
VPRVLRERGLDEGQREADGLVDAVLAGTKAKDVGVVVLAGERRRLGRPGQRGPDAGDLIRGDLLAVPGAADHDAEAAGVADNTLRRAQHVHGVVVIGVIAVRAAVDGLVARLFQRGDQRRLELEARMVGSQVYAHAASLPEDGGKSVAGAWRRGVARLDEKSLVTPDD